MRRVGRSTGRDLERLASRRAPPKMSAFGSRPRKKLVIAVRICITSLAVVLVLGAVPAVAAAKPGCGAGPTVPADSEIDQYAQSIPGACGNQQNDAAAADPVGAPGEAADPGMPDRRQSRPRPCNGFRTSARTAPGRRRSPRRTRRRSGGDGGGRGSEGAGGSDSGAGSVLDALLGSDEGDGMGLVLPLILLAITAAGIVFVARRRMSQAG